MMAIKVIRALLAFCTLALASDGTGAGSSLRFELNVGQTSPTVSFLSRWSGNALFLTPSGAILRTPDSVWKMDFVGANPAVEAIGLQSLQRQAHYLIGTQEQWHTEVPSYGRVEYRNIYPGVDIIYSGDQGRLQYDLVIHPGADPSQITLRFEGTQPIQVDAGGGLVLRTLKGEWRHANSESYQIRSGAHSKVAARLMASGPNEATVAVGRYDRFKALTITYSTYLGGTGQDSATSIAVDTAGNTYLTGWTESTDFPEATGTRLGKPSSLDAYVAKLSPAGTLVYITYLGGTGQDQAFGVAVDNSGSAVVVGTTYSTNFPVLNAVQPSLAGGHNAFVAKLNTAGNGLIFSTFLGGNGADTANAVALDAQGNIYVAGETTSANFPVLNPLQFGIGGGDDAFVCKFSSGGARLYSTFLGGIGNDRATAIAVDTSGYAYVTGSTYSTNFPTLNAFQAKLGGGQDAFAAKIGVSGNSLIYSTYLGGSGGTVSAPETGNGIAVDSTGSAYIAGATSSANFPTLNPLQASLNGSEDAFVVKLSAVGSAPVYSTYLGGSSMDVANAIAIDDAGNAYIAGYTASTDFPLANAIQSSNAGVYDAFVLELNSAGNTLEMGTYLGGSGADSANDIALDSSGNLYVAGQTLSNNFPTAGAIQIFQPSPASTFFLKIPVPHVPSVVSGAPATATGPSATFIFVAGDPAGYADVNNVYFLVNPTPGVQQNTCHGFYNRTSNAFYLYNDALTMPMGPLTPGTAGTLQNSECILYGSSSGLVSATGTTLSLKIGLGAEGGYANTTQGVYLWVKDNEGDDTGWVQTGTWKTNNVPSVVSGAPASATGPSATFTFVAGDPAGYADINNVYFLVNPTPGVQQNTCHGFYNRASNAFYLYNDVLTLAMGPLTPGTAGTLQNSQCILYGSSSGLLSAAGTNLTLNIGLGTEGKYASTTQGVYLWVKDNEGDDTGWVQTGTWKTSNVPSVASGAPATATSPSAAFTFVAGDTAGYADIDNVYFLVNALPSIQQNTCHGLYNRASNVFYLYNDALTVAMGPLIPGTAGTLQNSQCILYGSSSGLVSAAGANLSLNIGLGTEGGYASTTQGVYLWVKDNEGDDTGWVQTGTWKTSHIPSVVSGAPATATGPSATFTFVAGDTAGYADINNVYFLVNPTPNVQQNTCHGLYNRAFNVFYLYNDALTVAMGPLIPGTAGTLQNSQCILYGSSSGLVSAAGTNLTLNIGLGTEGGYASTTQGVYLWLKDNEGDDTGWVQTGTWKMP